MIAAVRVGMIAAVRTEFRKVRSTRMWWVLTLVMFAYMAFLGAVMAFSFTVDLGEAGIGVTAEVLHGQEAALIIYSMTSPLGYVFPLVIGSLIFTNEFRHQTITPSLLADPRRGVLVLAKLLVAAAFGVLIALVANLGTLVGGAPLLHFVGDGAYLGTADTRELLAWSCLVMVVWTILGVAIGGLVKNQVAAIIILVGFTQFVEPIARLGLGAVDVLAPVASYLPGAAADAVLGTSFFSELGTTDLLGRMEGLAVLIGYVAVFAGGSRWITLRRDIS